MMKPLIVFDIDGTITNTTQVDDFCFIQTYKDLYRINLEQADWNEFKHFTDLGISNQIFQDNFKRLPEGREIDSIKYHFLKLLKIQFNKDPGKFSEVTKAVSFINDLCRRNYPIAIATGGWQETAIYKLEKVGIELNGIPFANSNHHYSRQKITEIAIHSAKEKYATDFGQIIYFGDGKWDLLTCQEMGIKFVGVDFQQNGELKELRAGIVIKDFENTRELINLI